jgi:hypothetical protein
VGRTLPTFTERTDALFLEWRPFRRALRLEDQEILDALFSEVRLHAQAGAALSPVEPWPAVLLAMLIEERKARLALAQKVAQIAEKADPASPNATPS